MGTSWKRRLGAIAVIVLILTAILVPAASAGGTCGSGSGCRAYYTVRPGDTLTRIAYRFGTSVAALQQCNRIWNADRIYIGQTLCICGGYRPCPPPPPKPCPPPPPQPLPPCPYPCQPVQPVPPPTGPWQSWYWNNMDLSGSPVLQQNVSAVNFNWGYGSPGPQVTPDNFSARYQRTLNIATGTYRVTTTADDGVRVSIDNVLVIDNWQVQPATTRIQDVIIMNGNHLITIEYFEQTELAQLSFSMVKISN
jgi:hypothetical protein